MSRTNKKSRIKGLPARLQLQELDCANSLSGFKWEDEKTINFTSASIVNAGFYLNSGSNWYTNASEQITSLYFTSSILKENSDVEGIVYFRNLDPISPFRDCNNPAVDGKSTNQAFYATGSSPENVGEGFSQPLWSKKKIEIDISSNGMEPVYTAISQSNVSVPNTGPLVLIDTDTNISYPMIYYNFDLKKWEPIGIGTVFTADKYYNSARDMYYSGTIGFTPGLGFNANNVVNAILTTNGPTQGVGPAYSGSWDGALATPLSLLQAASASIQNTNIEYFDKMGRITDNYTFPYGPQYHATSSQTLKLKNYISKPFLAEKIVIEMSGATYTVFDTINSNGFYPEQGVIYPFAKNNIFIMNQRKNRKFFSEPEVDQYYAMSAPRTLINKTVSIPETRPLTYGGSNVYVDTNRDLITFGSITSMTNDFTGSLTRYLVPTTPTIPVASDITTSLFYFRVPQFASALFEANLNPITQSYFLEDFIYGEDDVLIQTSKSLSTYRMGALGFENESFQIELNVKTPNIYPNGGNTDAVLSTGGDALTLFSTYDIELGGRNLLGLTNVSGRDLLNSYGTTVVNANIYGPDLFLSNSPELFELLTGGIIDGITFNMAYPYSISNIISFGVFNSISPLYKDESTNKLSLDYTKPNPYVLFPEDELIIGWQQPTPNLVELNTYLSMSISGTYGAGAPYSFTYGTHHVTGVIPHTTTPAPNGEGIVHISSIQINGPAKLIIYGTEVCYGQEQNNTDEEVITSKAIHKVIG